MLRIIECNNYTFYRKFHPKPFSLYTMLVPHFTPYQFLTLYYTSSSFYAMSVPLLIPYQVVTLYHTSSSLYTMAVPHLIPYQVVTLYHASSSLYIIPVPHFIPCQFFTYVCQRDYLATGSSSPSCKSSMIT